MFRTSPLEARRALISQNLVRGLNYTEILEQVRQEFPAATMRTVVNDVRILLRRWRAQQLKDMSDYVDVELKRFDELHAAIWDQAIEGNPLAIDRILKISEKRLALLAIKQQQEETKPKKFILTWNTNSTDDQSDDQLLLTDGSDAPTTP